MDAMMSPWALRIGAAAAVRPVLELVDRECVPGPSYAVELGAQPLARR